MVVSTRWKPGAPEMAAGAGSGSRRDQGLGLRRSDVEHTFTPSFLDALGCRNEQGGGSLPAKDVAGARGVEGLARFLPESGQRTDTLNSTLKLFPRLGQRRGRARGRRGFSADDLFAQGAGLGGGAGQLDEFGAQAEGILAPRALGERRHLAPAESLLDGRIAPQLLAEARHGHGPAGSLGRGGQARADVRPPRWGRSIRRDVAWPGSL